MVVIYLIMRCILCNVNRKVCEPQLIAKGVRDSSHARVFFCKKYKLGFLKSSKEIKYEKSYNSNLLKANSLQKLHDTRLLTLQNTINKLKKMYNFKSKNVLEIGPGNSPVYNLINNNIKSFYICEENLKYKNYIKKKYDNIKILDKLDNTNNIKFDCIIMIHVFEHISQPLNFLNEVYNLLNKKGSLLIVVPNLDDIYSNELNKKTKKKYYKFMFHVAHKFYYTLKSLKELIKKTKLFEINHISTFQEYSISNFFHWYFYKKPNKTYLSAITTNLNSNKLNQMFIDYCEKQNKGSSLVLRVDKISE